MDSSCPILRPSDLSVSDERTAELMSEVLKYLTLVSRMEQQNAKPGRRPFHGTILDYGMPCRVTPDTFTKEGRGIYCEGFADSIVPVLHAWCIDELGNVIDPTWRKGNDYHGIPYTTEYVSKVVEETGYWGSMIDNYHQNYPLLYLNFDLESVIHPIRLKLKNEPIIRT